MSTKSSPPALIDVDCNLWHSDLKSLLSKAEINETTLHILEEDAVREQNIVAMLSPSSTINEARSGMQLLRSYQGPLHIKTTVGVHPYHVNDEALQELTITEHVAVMRDLLVDHGSTCAAIGECGLDASDGFPPIADQVPWFQAQIKLAEALQLPLFVHERLGFEMCMTMLQETTVPVIIHCFTGTANECAAYMERGYSISFSGYLFKPEAEQARECLRRGLVPLDKLMIETDAPYMGFANCRKHYLAKHFDFVANNLNAKQRKRLVGSTYPNLPSALPMVLDKVLEEINIGRAARNERLLSRDELAKATTHNAIQFFGFEPLERVA
ncbi:hypothetical protein MPSEU_000057700 [Mayamaea pseudoterrestris]|nr:hypothetical protein MPSEU_000057700 [Mayamaea pseudoterrestris]